MCSNPFSAQLLKNLPFSIVSHIPNENWFAVIFKKGSLFAAVTAKLPFFL